MTFIKDSRWFRFVDEVQTTPKVYILGDDHHYVDVKSLFLLRGPRILSLPGTRVETSFSLPDLWTW